MKNAHLLRCAASFVVATYAKVRLAPHDLRALHLSIFEQPLNIVIQSCQSRKIFFTKKSDLLRFCVKESEKRSSYINCSVEKK